MWLGQAKFFCTVCGSEITDGMRKMIEKRCKELAISPQDLGEKARDVARLEMLKELGEESPDPTEFAFVKATALLLLELAYSPNLLCSKCRSPESAEDLGERVRLRLIKGGKGEE